MAPAVPGDAAEASAPYWVADRRPAAGIEPAAAEGRAPSDCPGRPHCGRGGGAARVGMERAEPARHLLQGRLPSGGVAGRQAYQTAALPTQLKFHAPARLRESVHRRGTAPLEVAQFMGHAKVTTTLGVYAHLYADDHTAAMAALGAMATSAVPNVVPLRAK